MNQQELRRRPLPKEAITFVRGLRAAGIPLARIAEVFDTDSTNLAFRRMLLDDGTMLYNSPVVRRIQRLLESGVLAARVRGELESRGQAIGAALAALSSEEA